MSTNGGKRDSNTWKKLENWTVNTQDFTMA